MSSAKKLSDSVLPQLLHWRVSAAGLVSIIRFMIHFHHCATFCALGHIWTSVRMDVPAEVGMAKDAGTQAENKKRRRRGPAIPLEQVSPAVLTSTRDVAFALQQLRLDPAPEEVLKAVLDRAAHLEEQASGITVFDD